MSGKYLFLDLYTSQYTHTIQRNKIGATKKLTPWGIKVLGSNEIYL